MREEEEEEEEETEEEKEEEEEEEGVVALLLLIMLFQTCYGLGPVLRCEPSTHQLSDDMCMDVGRVVLTESLEIPRERSIPDCKCDTWALCQWVTLRPLVRRDS